MATRTQRVFFEQFGRACHLRIRDAADLEHALRLDEAQWVATSAPISSLNFDPVFLRLLDPDQSGRIVCDEVRKAIRWAFANLADRSGIGEAATTLQLDAVNTDKPEGQQIRRAAERMLQYLDRPGAGAITLAQVREIRGRVETALVSGAGVVLPEAAADKDVQAFMGDIVATLGGVPHPSEKNGVNQEQLDAFLEQAKAWLAWQDEAVLAEGKTTSPITPIGSKTAKAFAIYAALRPKIDQFFAQCEAIAFDHRVSEHLALNEEEFKTANLDSPESIRAMLRKAPLARPNAESILVLEESFNPFYSTKLIALGEKVLAPLFGSWERELSLEAWQRVKAAFAPHEAWHAREVGALVGKLGREKLTRYLDDRLRHETGLLVTESSRSAVELDQILLTEKLVLFQANLLQLANNYISFPFLYDPKQRAMFEMGTLVMDGRRFTFSIRADCRSEHSNVAKNSNIYLLYAKVFTGKDTPDYEVAVPVTAGSKGNLFVGKRGLFVDVRGRQFDARIEQILENPIGLGEALASPYQRIGKLLSGKIESMTASAEEDLDAAAKEVLTQHPPLLATKAAQPPGLMAGGLLLGGGVALAAVGSALAYITSTLASMEFYKILLGVALAVLAVMLPTSILAIIKLRSRDLSAILEGAGWAINARMRLTFRLGRVFTHSPPYPKGARGVRRIWVRRLLAAAILAELTYVCSKLAP